MSCKSTSYNQLYIPKDKDDHNSIFATGVKVYIITLVNARRRKRAKTTFKTIVKLCQILKLTFLASRAIAL